MNSPMMQSHAADSSQAAQVYSFTQTRETLIPETRLVPFSDNFDHLQALELEAKLMVAVATLRRGDRRGRGDDEPISAIFPFLHENADHRQAEEMLTRIEAENRQREELSQRQGIDLNFISFCKLWALDRLERKVVLLLLMQFTSHDFADLFSRSGLEKNCDNGMEIGVILSIISPDLRSQLDNRRLFSVQGKLNKEEIIEGHCENYDRRTSILKVSTYLHERHSRYIIGDTNQYNSEFSVIRQEKSIVRLEQVIMEDDLKREVVSTVERFQAARQSSRQDELDRFFGYGTGLAMLFYGPSGTGKTMLARGLANHLNAPLLTLNMEELDNAPVHGDDVVRLLFREAALIGGIVLLDECDDIFSGMRNHGMSRALLLELENSRCITILATNQPLELDPAMERRLALKVHFQLPDACQRLRMWQSLLPASIPLAENVALPALADRYLFTGGLIKNVILMAANASIAEKPQSPVITLAMLEKGAGYQSQSLADAGGLCTIYNPVETVDSLILHDEQKEEIRNTANAWKRLHGQGMGLSMLLTCDDVKAGVQAAGAIASSCGIKVKRFDFSDVCSRSEEYRVIDPVSQRKVPLLRYALSPMKGDAMMVMFVDYEGAMGLFLQDNKDTSKDFILSDLTSGLRAFNGFLCLVTKPLQTTSIPLEFNLRFDLKYPSNEIQQAEWLHHLGGTVDQDDLSSLVRQYPMHASEIAFITHQAAIRSVIKGRTGRPTIEAVKDVISQYRRKRAQQVLFGGV